MGAGLSRERRRLAAAALRSSSALLQPGGAQACLSTVAGQSWGGQALGRAATNQLLASGNTVFALPVSTRGFAASPGGSGPARVNEATVRRLVQHSRVVAEKHRNAQKLRLAAEELAARVRLLLADGWSEAQVAEVIDRTKGGPYFDTEEAAQTLGLLQRLGLTVEQRAGCVAEALSLLSCSPDQVAAVVQLLRAELGANNQQVVQLICRAAQLLQYLPETLAAKLAWWRGQARSEKTQRALLASLRQHPKPLSLDTETAGSKLALLQAKLGTSDEAMARKLPAAVQLMSLDMECTVLPRVDFLLGLLGEVAGGVEAARSMVRKDASVLSRDVSRPAPAARIAFWCQVMGLAPGELLLAHPSLPLRRLDTLAPRWAWVQRHRPGPGLGAKYVQQADADCMAKYGVPLEGFAEFKAAWLTSEEGRAVCRHEREVPGGGAKAGGESEGEEEEVGI